MFQAEQKTGQETNDLWLTLSELLTDAEQRRQMNWGIASLNYTKYD